MPNEVDDVLWCFIVALSAAVLAFVLIGFARGELVPRRMVQEVAYSAIARVLADPLK